MRTIALLTLAIAAACAAEEAPTLLIAPFENLSGVRQTVDYEVAAVAGAAAGVGGVQVSTEAKRVIRVDRLSDAPRSLLEDAVVNLGGKVVERQRLDALMQEADFVRVSGLANPGDAVRWGKLAGASAILVGTIQQLKAETKSFQGYGIATQRTIVTAEVRVRFVGIESGQVRYSKTVTGTADKTDTRFASATDGDVAYGVVKDAVAQVVADPGFVALVKGTR